ncbi:hypothetical protein [Pseudomonas paraeruginosa]|uniref:hypothetical protein n=1 Tax=Pseudomonas paraeruginosa TaxID=2994495 RepID=UPI00053DE936|nr:hypothetical protein [Pseudomonas paraeruginosa]
MIPIFLPHTALDAVDGVEAALLPGAMQQGRHRLRALRDRAIAEGAHVLLLLWPSLEWVLLAVDVPADVVIEDAARLIPNLMANPEALVQMQRNARQGQHLSWLQLRRPTVTTH